MSKTPKMTELKTLKDFEGIDCGCCARTALSPDELKAEAVKWVKGMCNARYGEGDNWKERLKGFEEFYDQEYDSFEEVINWIKHFFNLTEEDLNSDKWKEKKIKPFIVNLEEKNDTSR